MKTLKTMLGENVYLVKMSNKDGKTMVRQYRAPSILSAESKAKVDAKLRGYSVESVRELSKEKDDLDEAKYVSSADYEVSASGRKVHKRKKIADDDYDKEDEVEDEDENEKEKKESFNFDSMEQIEEDVWYCGEDLDLQLDEAQQRYSSSYQFTHKPGDAESEKKLSGLKKMVKGTGKRVVLMGRLGKDNPNAHKYKKGGEVSSNRSQFAGTHKYIKKGDAAHHDVYVYDRRESVEHIEEATVKKANYSWGKMMTVHHGADHSYPLHPEHQEAIRKLKHGEKTSFKDETGTKVTVHRDADEVHFTSNRSANKTIVAHSHFKESVEIDEAVDPQESRFFQLARLGLVDKADVTKLRMAMGQLNSDKALSIKQRELLLSTFQSLVDIVTGDDAIFTRVRMDVQKEETELDENTEALQKKASKTGVSLSTLKKVYARGVAAWNSGHRPGTTPQQWGMARVNSYVTKGKGTYHGADKDLREGGEPGEFNVNDIDESCWLEEDARMDKAAYHSGMTDSMKAARVAHWKKMDKKSDKDPSSYKPAPGDATAETKPSVHTKKYHAMYGEGIDFDKIRADAADHIKKSIDKQSDDRIAVAKNPPKKPGFFARVGQKQINMVKGAYHGLTKEGKDEIPFEGPYTKVKDVVTDKSGGKHTPMSRVRHLARMALKKQAEKK